MTTQARMSRRGFRIAREAGFASPGQLETARELADKAEEDGARIAEFRACTYCGPGSAGDLGAYNLVVDGRIYATIFKDGESR